MVRDSVQCTQIITDSAKMKYCLVSNNERHSLPLPCRMESRTGIYYLNIIAESAKTIQTPLTVAQLAKPNVTIAESATIRKSLI